MKIVVNTNYDSAGTKVCVDGLMPKLKQAGHVVAHNDWDRYQRYDMALFMSPDSEVAKAKSQNGRIVCGIMDPKIDYRHLRDNVKAADFCIVSSIEQRDLLYQYNRNVFIYYMFPDTAVVHKEHRSRSPIIIGYHGNKEHLDCLKPQIVGALNRLALMYPIEFWAMYNVGKSGEWRHNLSSKIPVRHIQWSEENYVNELAKVDIGIVNNEIPLDLSWRRMLARSGWYRYGLRRYPTRQHDTIVRYKYSTNPGRVYVFAQMGIPVVTDFAPSANQFVRDGKTGMIAHTEAGWVRALEKLIVSAELRQSMSDSLRDYIDMNYSIDKNFEALNKVLQKMVVKSAGVAEINKIEEVRIGG